MSVRRVHISFKGCLVTLFILIHFLTKIHISKHPCSAASNLGLHCLLGANYWTLCTCTNGLISPMTSSTRTFTSLDNSTHSHLSIWMSPFPILCVSGKLLHFNFISNRNSCMQTAKPLIRRRVLRPSEPGRHCLPKFHLWDARHESFNGNGNMI